MLYLAEIQKQKGGFIGSGKAELRLLACQRTEQNWSAIQGEELVLAPDEASNYGTGVLMLVDMNANRQIQGSLREASRHLVGILQNLSRQIEKYKKEADEIESWRQSLGLQSQQLQLRQEEIFSREEELEFTRAELERLTSESQHLEATLKSSENELQEITTARAKMHEESKTLAQQKRVAGLSTQQITAMRSLVSQFQGSANSLHAIEFQEDLLHQHWDKLHQQQQKAAVEIIDLQKQQQLITEQKLELQQLQTTLEQSQTAWEVQQNALSIRQEYSRQLTNRIQLEDENYQKILMMARGGLTITTSDKVDVGQIEKMPVTELESVVASLQKEVDQANHLVQLQEEELVEQQAFIAKMDAEISNATAFEKLRLENELSDEQDGYQMLEQTLEGQRETLMERQAILQVHISVLEYRQSQSAAGDNHWDEALQLLAGQRQQEELERSNMEIQHLQAVLEQAKAKVEIQVNEYLAKSEEVQKLEQDFQSRQLNVTEVQAKVTLYEDMIQPLQNHINGLKDQLGNAAGDHAVKQLETMLDELSYNGQDTLGA
jgi:predicted regulator of Ras-like GTPase activity (Roadblock/LC7/MglB family)